MLSPSSIFLSLGDKRRNGVNVRKYMLTKVPEPIPNANKEIIMAESQTLTLIHFNDVYEIDSRTQEPVGGAARFATAIKSYDHLNPLVLFSGDCFSPSLLSSVTKGEQMVPVLHSVKTACAMYGNHEFDHSLHNLIDVAKKTNFPWLMSNVIDNETGRPLGDGIISHTLEHWSSVMGLVEFEWMETLGTIDPHAVTYQDFTEVGNKLAKELRDDGCDLVIALTHMRIPNDLLFAEKSKGVDIILGGHDHIYDLQHVKGIPILKSGTDFRDFSVIKVEFDENKKPSFTIDHVEVTSDFAEDEDLKKELEKYRQMMDTKLNDVLGEFAVELDGRFSSVRSAETNLGNFICDIMIATTHAECALLNSGALRSNRVHTAGDFTRKDLTQVLPFLDFLVVLNVSGAKLLEALENSVSRYPALEGRFPQISGMRFAFDPAKPAGQRVDPRLVLIGDEYLQLNEFYRLCTEKNVATGHDGYTVLADAEVLMHDEACLVLTTAVQNHFHAIDLMKERGQHAGKPKTSHRQSLVTKSRRHSLLRGLDKHEGSSKHVRPSVHKHGDGIHELEKEACDLRPLVEGRIIVIDSKETLDDLVKERQEWESAGLKTKA